MSVSGWVPTLLYLTVAATTAFVVLSALDELRGRILIKIGTSIDRCLKRGYRIFETPNGQSVLLKR